MRTTYFKRLRMEINLRRVDLPEPVLPEGYEWRAWHPVLIEAHARVKWESFRSEIDALLFPSNDAETQGMVLLEAVAVGLPVLYCDAVLDETVPAGGGLRCADSSVDAMAESIEKQRRA